MKATGIVRRIDDLGRVVVPKEIRKVLRIREGDPLEIYTDTSGSIILRKYSPINELGKIAEGFAETASSVLGLPVLVSDTDHFVAVSGTKKNAFLDMKIDDDLDRIIQKKSKYKDDTRIVIPILTNGDPIGSVTILPENGHKMSDTELKAAELGAGFLAKQMEN